MNVEGSYSVADASRFAKKAFLVGIVLSLSVSAGFALYVTFVEDWNSSKIFNTVIVLWGLGFMFPSVAISVKLAIRALEMASRTLDMTSKALTNSEKMAVHIEDVSAKIYPIIEEVSVVTKGALPIVENVGNITARAQGMSDDLEKIAHTVRAATDKLNGSLENLDLKAIEKRLEDVAESLKTLAGMFSPRKKKMDEPAIPDLFAGVR